MPHLQADTIGIQFAHGLRWSEAWSFAPRGLILRLESAGPVLIRRASLPCSSRFLNVENGAAKHENFPFEIDSKILPIPHHFLDRTSNPPTDVSYFSFTKLVIFHGELMVCSHSFGSTPSLFIHNPEANEKYSNLFCIIITCRRVPCFGWRLWRLR